MFSELEESKIEDGNFKADGRSKMFEKSKKLDIDGGFFLATNEKQGSGSEESDSENDGGEMFKGLEQSTLTKGVFVSQGGGKMFEKSKRLVITGGSYTASGGGTKPRKGKNTAEFSQQAYGLTHSSGSLGYAYSNPASYPTANVAPYLQSPSVPVASRGYTYHRAATLGASVQLTHTQKTAPIPEAPNLDVPNHPVQQTPNSSSIPMDVDANRRPSELDTENSKKKDNKFTRGVNKALRNGQSWV